MKALRTLVAVLVGYLVFAASAFAFFRLTGIPPHADAGLATMALSILVGMIAATAGGYAAAALATAHPVRHATGVAAVIALGATVSLVMTLGHGAIWSQVTAIVLVAPSAITGGAIRGMAAP